MRIVRKLNEIDECPNCGSGLYLRETEDESGRPCVVCINCHEEFYEDEDSVPNVDKALDNIDDSLINVEWAICDLPRYATTQHELEQMERIRNIFDELISVIRRMK